MTAPSTAERFWTKVNKDGPVSELRPDLGACWLWTGGTAPTKSGSYGRFWTGEQLRGAHRVAYELIVGPIPDGLQIDHLCRVTLCVNPAHLEPVTNQENTQRGVAGQQADVCPRGHAYTPNNLYVYGRSRQCRRCTLSRSAAARARKKEVAS